MIDFEPVEPTHVAYVVMICQLIPTVVTLYDHLITFDQEVELVWKKPQTLAKTFFLWNRYFGSIFLLVNVILLSVPPSHDHLYVLPSYSRLPRLMTSPMNAIVVSAAGRFWLIFQACGTAIIIWSMQSTVLFCTCAMYPHSTYIRTAAFVGFVCEVASMATILGLAFIKLEATDSSVSGHIFCIPDYIPSFFYAFWIPVITLDCIYFFLAFWVLVRRRERGLHNLATSGSILETLVRDSLAYFCVTLLTYVANVVVWVVLPARWIGLPQAFSIAGTSIMGVKLAFNLRGVYYCQSISINSDGRLTVVVEDPGFINEAPAAVTPDFHVLSGVTVLSGVNTESRS